MENRTYNECKITFELEHPLTDLKIIEALEAKGYSVIRTAYGDEKVLIIRKNEEYGNKIE